MSKVLAMLEHCFEKRKRKNHELLSCQKVIYTAEWNKKIIHIM